MDATLIVGLVGLVALVKKIVDYLRLAANLPGSKSSFITQTIAYVAGVAGTFLMGATQFADKVDVHGILLSNMDGPTKTLVGLSVGSAASVVTDFVQARDNNDSAAIPPLLGRPTGC